MKCSLRVFPLHMCDTILVAVTQYLTKEGNVCADSQFRGAWSPLWQERMAASA